MSENVWKMGKDREARLLENPARYFAAARETARHEARAEVASRRARQVPPRASRS
jgi:hypothetical protein